MRLVEINVTRSRHLPDCPGGAEYRAPAERARG